MATSWLIRARTLKGQVFTVGPFEKRYCEQVLADIRNKIALDNHEVLESHDPPVHYDELDLSAIGMEAGDSIE